MEHHELLILGGGNAGISLAVDRYVLPATYWRRILRGKV